MSGWFTTEDGRKFSPQERKASSVKSRKAVADGEIPKPEKCNRCGQTEGYVSYHNHDYAHHTKYLECLCWRCHAMWHSKHFAPRAVEAYFTAVEAGKKWPSLVRPGWHLLAKDHGVVHPRERHLYKVTGDCKRCGQDKGVMRYWFGPQDELPGEMVCWWCWAMLWKGTVERYAIPVKRYWAEVAEGKRQAPVKAPAWGELQDLYGIPEKA